MKIRHGFVSNSSSSSFVIGKNWMTDEQIRKFQDFLVALEEGEDGDYSETYISDQKHYFVGSIDQIDYTKIDMFFVELGLSEYVGYGD